ncbi:PKD domain-containing protein [Halapricum sp. CBA1109]|uniref:PKD domain-containing protein n=1 Tax=Halapricum sp. CBA1109 TaxID=2668068 RepID=UPI0012F9DF35|nr:PKD domain-containing protein [Halapricum sp. CBA1109]MUV90305.1 PKD domain-containing protein [Halapricum sp. CBA1109]
MTARAQSETVGVVLLVGVFAVATITIGVLVIGNVADDAESQPRVDLNVSVTPDNVTLTHGGGDTVDVADVEVVVRNGEESRYDLPTFDERRGDGDDRFDPGERFRHDHDQGAGDLRIIVVHVPSNSVLADVTRSARTPDPPDAPLTNAEPSPRIEYAPVDPTPGESIVFDASTSSDPDGTIDRYDWDWTDDGSYEGSGETATHTYDAPGNYTVRLRVVDNGSATNTTTRTVQVVVSQPPTANVTYTPDSPGSGESITFDGSASSDPDGSITGYRWDWTGDGSYEGSGETATHTYPAPGRYDVTLEVTDDDSLTATETRTVRVNSPPTARFGQACSDGTCTFDASNSTDDGAIANYTWAFGDGTTAETADPTVEHTYDTSDTYDVTLTVTDSFGATDDTTRTVDNNDPPTARFGRNCSGLECTFDAGNATDDGSITAYEWAFGDGETAVTADPVIDHTYDSGGTYDVTLTVTDGAGEQDNRTRTVDVNAPPTVTNPTLVDATDSNATVSDGDTIRVEATVFDDGSGVDTVTADASAFDAGTLSMADPDSDGVYTTTATVGPNATEGNQSVTLTATDVAGNTATATTGTLTVDTTPPTIATFDVVDDGQVVFLFFWAESYTVDWTATDQNLASTTVTVNRSGTTLASYTTASGSETSTQLGSFGTEYTVRIVAVDAAGNRACRTVTDESDGTDPGDSQYSSC